MRYLPAVVCILLFGVLLPQHTALGQVIEGRVIDPDEAAIAGASISIRMTSRELVARAASDENGFFNLGPIDPGDYFVLLERLGYKATQTPISLRESDSISVELRMAIEAIPLAPITVTASPRPSWEYLEPPFMWEFWERKEHFERLGAGSFFTYEDLKPYGGQPLALTITDLAPFLISEASPMRRTSYFIKGRFDCYPPVFIDGHQVKGIDGDPQNPSPPILDDYIHSSQIGAVEIYRGSSDVPGEFRALGANCGAVVVWTLRHPKG